MMWPALDVCAPKLPALLLQVAVLSTLPETKEDLSRYVAVVPDVVSEIDAARLRAIVDRRWSHFGPVELRLLQEEGYDGDNLIENTDRQPSYSCDILDSGYCTSEDSEQYTTEADCDFVQDLIREAVTPSVRRVLQKWPDLPRTLYPCDSFVKRYQHDERASLPPHLDDSVITANVLLTDPLEFQGGLVIYPGAASVDLSTEMALQDVGVHVGAGITVGYGAGVGFGSLVIHRGSLWHSIKMLRENASRRYVWITWYAEDGADCRRESGE